jgi:copper chaperone CopZ
VQSALQNVKGVKEANVWLGDQEATVKYDSGLAKVEDLIKALKEANGPHGPYDAKVKKKSGILTGGPCRIDGDAGRASRNVESHSEFNQEGALDLPRHPRVFRSWRVERLR